MPDTEQPVIATARLTKIFRDFWLRDKVTAVCDLDIEIMPREVFGLLGPNGSGKSTTLKMILGLMFPTRGRISVFGKRPSDVQIKHRIGFLPEETYLYPFLDARETLDYYGRLFHQNRRQRRKRIDMLLDMVGLSTVSYRRIGEYSKGMKRLIGMAQALINDPDLLILDEPTSGMDPIATKRFKDLIQILAQRGKTVLLSSHLLGDVEDVCDRICVLYAGKSRAMGRIDDLLSHETLTQITIDDLDSQTLDKLKNILSAAGKEIKEVAAPRDRLETLFLRIVSDARAQRIVTGGVGKDGQVAEFLRATEDEEAGGVVERLVSAAQTASQTETLPQTAAETKPNLNPPKPPAKADRTVIDELLEGGNGENEGL